MKRIFISIIAAMIVLTGCGATNEKTTTAKESASPVSSPAVTKAPEATASAEAVTTEAASPEPTAKQDAEIPSTLGINATEFQTAFNKASKEFGDYFNISSLKIEEGLVLDSFKYEFSNSLIMNASINKKDSSIREILLIVNPDGTTETISNFVLAMGVLIIATNPTLDVEDRESVLVEFGLNDPDSDISNLKVSAIRNNIKYTFRTDTGAGIWLIASDANEVQ
ncbi:hypothetical protein BBD42_23535 [Paenibacillus sp. BIHB 4019]|uniref:Lipoprotein n=1 Tax=Paenibacillus sp. BIHB 4019 TaxID=1870819 RepID=A0A1B2DN33_9BACL|nr:hypothetical protein [Paenibacillus sp. BIHB 4019]ANY69122.1 hypothetical protein BBD42_23535 [Paenibacillus sp. BIHB 4019]